MEERRCDALLTQFYLLLTLLNALGEDTAGVRIERANREILMSALMNGCVAGLRKRRISIVLMMALAYSAVAAHDNEKGAEGSAISSTMPAVEAQHLVWHQQQTGLVELDSLTGFLRLFLTMADELAAQGASSRDDDASSVLPVLNASRRFSHLPWSN
jgi:hypothetical protein